MKIKLPSLPRKAFLIFGIVAVLLIAFIPSYYFYSQYQKIQKLLQNPTEAAREEARTLIAKVGSLIELPAGEEPTIATVSDKKKLTSQPFFLKAENGDKVLIYTQGRKAILFRPRVNKVIEVAPINLGQPQEPTAGGTGTKPIKIALYNGTTTVGLTKTAEKQLKESPELAPKIEVVIKENAQKQDYTKTKVIDLTGTQKEIAQKIATILDGEVSSVPDKEILPKADILIIIGK